MTAEFWERLLRAPATPSDLIRLAATEGVLPDPNCVNGQGALALYLQGQAEKRAAEASSSRRNAGDTTPPADVRGWHRAYRIASDQWPIGEDEELAVVDALLAAGARVDVPAAPGGLDALEWAFRKERPRVFARLLAHPSAPGWEKLVSRMADGERPWLHWAAGASHIELLQALLNHGASVAQRDGRGRTAAFFARTAAHAALLVERGADLTAAAANGESAFFAWCHATNLGRPVTSENCLLAAPWGAAVDALMGLPRYRTRKGERGAHAETARCSDALLAYAAATPDWVSALRTPGPAPWRGRWTLPALYAHACLTEMPGVAAIHPLLRALAAHPPAWESLEPSHRKLPDRGWWALACWSQLEPEVGEAKGLSEDAWKWARRSLGVRDAIADRGVVEDALAVSARVLASGQKHRRAALGRAWNHWLRKASVISCAPVGQVLLSLGPHVKWDHPQALNALRAWAPEAGFPVDAWVGWLASEETGITATNGNEFLQAWCEHLPSDWANGPWPAPTVERALETLRRLEPEWATRLHAQWLSARCPPPATRVPKSRL